MHLISELYTNETLVLFDKNPNEIESILNRSMLLGYKPKKIYVVFKHKQILDEIEEIVNIPIFYISITEYRLMVLEGKKQPKTLIGVTGSSAKSSICYMLYKVLENSFISSSIGIGSTDLIPNTMSSVPFADLWYHLDKNYHCKYGILEITSHALDQERIFGVKLKIGIFTKLEIDHLDYHKTFENYMNTKISIIDYIENGGFFVINESILNMESFNLSLMYKKLHEREVNLVIFQSHTVNQQENIELVKLICDLLQEPVQIPDHLSLRGRFYEIKKNDSHVVIDGAHNPNQITNIINSYQGQKTVIFGIAGHRLENDIQNVDVFNKVLTKEDLLVVTDDDPRHLKSLYIIERIVKLLKIPYKIERNRFNAIEKHLKDNLLMILGKSSETQNIINFEVPKSEWEDFLKLGYLEISDIDITIKETENMCFVKIAYDEIDFVSKLIQ